VPPSRESWPNRAEDRSRDNAFGSKSFHQDVPGLPLKGALSAFIISYNENVTPIRMPSHILMGKVFVLIPHINMGLTILL
jgi:hypothetical protein